MGGGAMRTAAKVAGIGVVGIRGAPLAPPAEQSLRKASLPASAVVSSQSAKVATTEVAAPVQTAPTWDMDDWEFPDEDELFMQAGEPMPRVVFGAVPSFQEAKEATTELKEAIDQVYLSSSSSNNCKASYDDGQVSVQSPHSELEPKYGATALIPTPAMPNHALQAFRYLSGSNEAQTVVASLVSDPNVWNAVIENPVLKDFLQSQKKGAAFELEKSSVKLEEMPDSEETGKPRNGFDFNGLLQNIQLRVAEMLSSVSKYLQSLFGGSEAEKAGSNVDGNPRASITDHITMKTFMGFAVLVGMVVLIRRG